MTRQAVGLRPPGQTVLADRVGTTPALGLRTTLGGRQVDLTCRRRRRGPKVRQERGQADGSIARSASFGLAAPPEGSMHRRCFQAEGLPQSKHVHTFKALTCGFGAPGRTRTCTLRIRSKTRPVRLVLPGGIAAGRVGSIVHLVASRPAPSQRPDCQRDSQPHDRPRHVRPSHWTPHRPGSILWAVRCRGRGR